MAEEWRVTLVFDRRAGLRYKHVCDLLRSRLGGDIKVSADKNQIFLYTTAAGVAEEADQVARYVLAEQNLSASVRREYWDAEAGDWRDPDASPQEAASPGKRRAVRTGQLDGILDVIAEIIPP